MSIRSVATLFLLVTIAAFFVILYFLLLNLSKYLYQLLIFTIITDIDMLFLLYFFLCS